MILVINSNIGSISHRFRDTISFRLKTHISPTPYLNTNLKMFVLQFIAHILHVSVTFDGANVIIRVKFPLKPTS